MKINAAAADRAGRSANERYVPIIGLERRKDRAADDDDAEYTDFKCYKDPADTTSAPRTVRIYHFDNESPEELLFFLKKLASVQKGQGLTNGPDRYENARSVLKGVALAAFDNAATANNTETNENFKKCVEAVKVAIFPPKAAIRQKRAMMRMRKPKNWTMRQFVARTTELINLLKDFPTTGITTFPEVADDEHLDWVEDALNNKYHSFLRDHGFNVWEHTMDEFVTFVEERIEPSDDKTEVQTKKDTPKKNSKRKSNHHEGGKKNSSNKRSKNHEFFCKQHGPNDTHNTEDCRYLKYLERKNNKEFSKEDIHVMVQEAADKAAEKATKDAIKKTNAAWKKRLRAQDNHVMDVMNDSITNLNLDEISINTVESETSEYSA